MSTDTIVSREYERTLIKIARVLPFPQMAQLVDFARFLQGQILSQQLIQSEEPSEVEADNARWDALLTTPQAQTVLEQLAGEALAEHRAVRTKPMEFNAEGRIVPK